MRRARIAATALVALALWQAGTAAAATHRVAIASFTFAPATIEIQMGETVEWTNVDPVVHTVTDEQGRFASGHMRQGQAYALTFSSAGRIQYFCETHDDMRAEVVVVPTGAAAAPTSTTRVTPTTSAAVPNRATAAPAQTTITTAPSPPGTDSPPQDVESLAAPGAPLPAPAASGISGGLVTGGRESLPAPLVATGVLLLALVGMIALTRVGVGMADATRWGTAALTLVAGALHAQLKLTIDYPEPIGTFMVIAAAASVLVAAYLVVAPWDWTVPAAGVVFHAVSLGAFAASRFGTLFGYHEVGWDPSPQAAATVAAEAGALALVVATAWLRRGQTMGAPRVS